MNELMEKTLFLWLIFLFSFYYCIKVILAIDKMKNSAGHIKNVVDSINEYNKYYLMCMIGTSAAKSSKKRKDLCSDILLLFPIICAKTASFIVKL